MVQILPRKQEAEELKYLNDNYYSGWELVRCGVMQGSALGPLLFNICIDDFPQETSKISEVTMFADDTSILCTAEDFNNLKMKLDIVFTYMSVWFQSNQFALNLDKTQMIEFITTSATSYPLYTLYFTIDYSKLHMTVILQYLQLFTIEYNKMILGN
jgi:hypothetical protein